MEELMYDYKTIELLIEYIFSADSDYPTEIVQEE